MRINFNSLNLGLSGGNRFVFELSNRLVKRGHEVTITHCGLAKNHKWFSEKLALINDVELSLFNRAYRKYVLKKKQWDFDFERALQKSIPECDVNVATYFSTAFPTYFSRKGKPFYLVQNFESWFFEQDDQNQMRAQVSYLLPMEKLCVSHWLADKVNGKYIGNGLNLSTFRKTCEKKYDPPYKIMVILRQDVAWKNHWFIHETLQTLRNIHHVDFVVQEPKGLSDVELVKMYNDAHVLLFASKFEGFGYPPLEAMACGTPVVTTNCLEYASHGQNCLIADSPESMAKNVESLLQASSYRDYIIEGGLRTARNYDFEKVVDRFADCVGCA